MFGQLKYQAQFDYFDYVNPQAPKLGTVRQGAFGTYDNFNVVIAGLKGNLASGIDSIYDTLLAPSLDEISAEYGLIAEAVSLPPDLSPVTFRLRPQAQWHDGRPITASDVIFSFHAFKIHNPRYSDYYRQVSTAVAIGPRAVTFIFETPGIRELPLIIGQLTILPKHWWESPANRADRVALPTPRWSRRSGQGLIASTPSSPATRSITPASTLTGAGT